MLSFIMYERFWSHPILPITPTIKIIYNIYIHSHPNTHFPHFPYFSKPRLLFLTPLFHHQNLKTVSGRIKSDTSHKINDEYIVWGIL